MKKKKQNKNVYKIKKHNKDVYKIKKHNKKFDNSINMYKKTSDMAYWNNFQRRKNLIFLNSLLKLSIKNGNFSRTHKILCKLVIKIRKKYKINIYKFAKIIYKRVVPVLGSKNWHMGKVKYKVPYYNLDEKKNIKIALSWFNNSIKRNYKNKGKFEDRFFKEIFNLYQNNPKCETIKKKKKYYLEFIRNKNTIRFAKYFIHGKFNKE